MTTMSGATTNEMTHTPLTLGDLIEGLRLRAVGNGQFDASNIDYYGKSASSAASAIADVVWGGQLLGQSVAATLGLHPDSEVHTMHSVFMRGGRVSVPLGLTAETLNDGRSFATTSVGFIQSEREIARSIVLTHRPDDDLIRHQAPVAAVAAQQVPTGDREDHGAYEVAYENGYDPRSREPGASQVAVWLRFPGAPTDVATNQALVSMATVPFMIGVAMRPHPGLTVGDSHMSVSTAVLSQTITFHESVTAGEWLRYQHDAYYSGRGRIHGVGTIFTAAGDLVASFSQDGMVRKLERRPDQPSRASF
jgi:acyl-CoA thioesterase-2